MTQGDTHTGRLYLGPTDESVSLRAVGGLPATGQTGDLVIFDGGLYIYALGSWNLVLTSASFLVDLDTSTVALGSAVVVVSDNTAANSNASSISTANVVGFVRTVGPIGTGKVQTSGNIPGVQFVSGLTLTAGDRVFLSLVNGKLTNTVTGLITPNVLMEVGVVSDASRYPLDSTASVIFLPKIPIGI